MPEDEEPHGLFIPIPEHLADRMREQADRQNMAGEVWRHQLRDFFESLNAEHIAVLRRMLDAIAVADDPANLCNFWEGILVAIMDLKFKMCMGCGKDHDDELLMHAQEVDVTVTPIPLTDDDSDEEEAS